MAQSPEEQRARQLLQDLEAAYRRLGETNPFANFNVSSFNDINDAIRVLQQGLNGVSNQLSMLDDDLTDIAAGFKNIVSSIRNTSTGLNLAAKSFNTLSSLAQKLKNDQLGISKLNTKELTTLKSRIETERENLITSQGILQTRISSGQATQKDIDALTEVNALINDQDGLYSSLLTNTRARLVEEKNIEKALGLGGNTITGIEKALQKMGLGGLSGALGLDKVREKMREVAEEVTDGGKNTSTFSDKFKVLKSGIGEVGKNLASSLKDPLLVSGFLVKQLTDAFLSLDTMIGNTAKSMGISYSQASQLNSEFTSIARENNNIFVTTKGLNESFNQINQALGTNGQLSKELLVTQTELVKQAGYSVEAATMLSKLSLATGKPTKEITTQFLGQVKALNLINKTAINEKALLESIAKASKSILVTFSGQPGKLAEAAYEAKRLGLELDQIEGIQNSLLDIESSIASEFEAEVLTGKQLNLEAARYYALTNDIAGLSKELGAQGITQAKFAGMNVIQQEAVAKAMGMSREQMASMLLEQEAISKLSSLDGDTAKEKYENAVKLYGVEKANAMLGDETLAQQMESASMQDKFLQSVEKLKEVFVGLVQPLMPVLDAFAAILAYISESKVALTVLQGVMAGLAVKSLINAVASIWSMALTPIGAILAVGATAALFSAVSAAKSKATPAGDLSSPASGKTQVSTKEGGLFELSKNDDLVAAPGLINKLNSPSAPLVINQPSAPQSPVIDYDKMALAMSRVQVQTNLDGVRVSSELQKAPLGMATRKI
jgi:hypothetical protein